MASAEQPLPAPTPGVEKRKRPGSGGQAAPATPFIPETAELHTEFCPLLITVVEKGLSVAPTQVSLNVQIGSRMLIALF